MERRIHANMHEFVIVQDIDGKVTKMDFFQGKVTLVVNLASAVGI